MSYYSVERQLEDFDPERRKEALRELSSLSAKGELFLPPPNTETNLHCHTFFSFNAYGYSPSSFAWRARRKGLDSAGIVDFDVLTGLEEFLSAGRDLNLRAVCGIETRVFVPELADKVINSPKEPGIAYFMGTGFGKLPAPGSAACKTLERMFKLAQDRNRQLLGRVNQYLKELAVDYERDVLPLTPAGNPTERHLLEAYHKRSAEVFGDRAGHFWAKALKLPVEQVVHLMQDKPTFQEVMRAKLMKYGSPGYLPPEEGAFPLLEEVEQMIIQAGGLPTAAWLDGTTEAESDIERLLDFFVARNTVVVNIIPDRNWNLPDAAQRAVKVAKLEECVQACRRRRLPIIIGTEMNKYGQRFVDDLQVPALSPYREDFLEGGHFVYGHTVLASCGPWSYFSPWAQEFFGAPHTEEGRRARVEFYARVGRFGPFPPTRWEELAAFKPEAPPDSILKTLAAGKKG